MSSLDRFASEKLSQLESRHLRRSLVETERADGLWVVRGGKRLLSFSCNDYLGLSRHPAVIRAAIEATARHGAGAAASRLITGNHPLFAELETRLARLKGAEAACVFGSGYLANTGIIPTLVGREDLILLDALSHACLWAGAKLSGAVTLPFRHNDVAHAEELLRLHRTKHKRALVLTDGVFSMEGDLAPLPELTELAGNYDAWLMVDDAHATGVVGGGRGSAFVKGREADVPLQMGTLSKAIGSYGGFLCASRPVIELIESRARSFVYSTGLPPASVAAAIAALDIMENDPAYTALPLAKARAFAARAGLAEPASPIVPVVVGDAEAALKASRLLEDEGFLVAAIRPPTVPAGTARLRLAFTALHTDGDVERLAELVRERILAA